VVCFAGVAQLVEHLICNQRVGGSNPFASSRKRFPEKVFAQSDRVDGGAAAGLPETHSIRNSSDVL
jgi:hypothetical protein